MVQIVESAHKRDGPFEATPTTAADKVFVSPFLRAPRDPPPSAMHHALCVTLHRTRLSEPTRTRDKHRVVIDICPYRSKGPGIIRAVQRCRGRRDHRDNVVSADHNCDYLVFTARESRTFVPPRRGEWTSIYCRVA